MEPPLVVFRLAHTHYITSWFARPEAGTELSSKLTVSPIEHRGININRPPIFGLQFSQAMEELLLHTSTA